MADRVLNLRAQREQRDDPSANDLLDLVQEQAVTRVVRRNEQVRVIGTQERQGHDPQAPRVALTQGAHRGVVAGPLAKVDERSVELDREDRGQLDLVEESVLAQDLAETLPSLSLGRQRAIELALRDEASLQQEVTHPRRGEDRIDRDGDSGHLR